jgi:hypothetical protein
MHPLHDYVAHQVAEHLKARSVVVWYDPRQEFIPFVDELRGGPSAGASPIDVMVSDAPATLIQYNDSMFEVRAVVEPLVSGERPGPTLIYVAGVTIEPTGSVLMELEKAGERYETQLKRLARNLLRQQYTDGVIDDLMAPEAVTYEDLARAAEPRGDGGEPSILKAIYHDVPARDDLLAAWLASDARDEDIVDKKGSGELAKLVQSRIGLALDKSEPVAKLRRITARYLLVGEFRDDLKAEPPAVVAAVPAARTKPDVEGIRAITQRLRSSHPDAYASLADDVEAELGLATAPIVADALGATDTFRFEERAVRVHVEDLIAEGRYDEADSLIMERERSFWLDRDPGRRAQWEACRMMSGLGRIAAEVLDAAASVHGDADDWIRRYADRADGWYRLDQAQRRLETWVASLDDEPAERTVGLMRQAHEDASRLLAERFVASLAKGGWATATDHQTRVYADAVQPSPKPVAYFLVDAMRYEMGVEFIDRLPTSAETAIRPAIAALPSITPIGMAALMPGAAASFDVIDANGKLGARIDGTFLPDLTARRAFAQTRVPGLVDMTLAELLGTSNAKLVTRFKDAQVIVVRSQEIDAAGEGGFYQARRTMDTVIDDLVRATRRLGAVGVQHAVVSADHGHLFPSGERDEAQRVDDPGGGKVDLHRRVWIGRGGKTPPGCVRVSAAALGNDSDLDLVFPPATAVFKAGGDLAFHHGGPTLQELVIPVVTIRLAAPPAEVKAEPMSVTGVPSVITNRIFSAIVRLGGANLALFSAPRIAQPMLVFAGRQVGRAAMAIDAEFDSSAGTVALVPSTPVTIGFMLTDDTVESVRLVVVDPATDAELYRSPADIPVRLGVA